MIKRSLDQMELFIVKNLKRMKLSCNLLSKKFVAQKFTKHEKKMYFLLCVFFIQNLFCVKKITKDEVEMESDEKSQCRHDRSLAAASLIINFVSFDVSS